MSCLFCALRDKKENILYENEKVFVILDRYPYSNRHLLIISKEHKVFLHDCQDETLSEMIRVVKELVGTLGFQSYNILQNNDNGQFIPHCHIHLIEANRSGKLTVSENTHLSWDDKKYATEVAAVKQAMGKGQ